MRLPAPTPLRDAETDHVWVIVPFSRPENAALVLENFIRQKFPFKKLIVVSNGRAITDPRTAILQRAGALMVTSDPHQSIAKNIALAEVRKRGGGFTAIMDDDDWYAPQYLTEACGYAKTHDVIGKGRHFVSVDGNLWLCGRDQANAAGDDWITGGTVACWAEASPEYTQVKWGEDATFCHTAILRGMRVRRTDLYHYLYRRDSKTDHAWPVSSEKLRRVESAQGALDLGREDFDVVAGRKLDVVCKLLASEEDIDTLPPPPEVTHVRS